VAFLFATIPAHTVLQPLLSSQDMDMRHSTSASICLGLLVSLAGCQTGPAGLWGSASGGRENSPADLVDLDQANEKLHRQLAQARQLHQTVVDELKLVKQQLAETADQLRTHITDGSKNETAAVPTIRSSLGPGRPPVVPISDLVAVADGETVRIEIPAERLFEPGTSQLTSDGLALLGKVNQAISQHYSRQLIAIEGHSAEAEMPAAAGSLHLQTANWSLAVLSQLVAGGASSRQLFTVAHGSNHPRYSSGSRQGRSGNQRIELVIYPDQVSGGS
jgi:outer membrane protein OmpA-like peptidoglycan-associated protein